MLDHALQEDVPAAFAKDGAPYSLEDLLSGLEPAPTDNGPDLEPALLLTEVAVPDERPANGWPAAEPEPPSAPAPQPEPEPEPDPEASPLAADADPTTMALSSIVEALRHMTEAEDNPPPQPAPFEPVEESRDLGEDDELVLTEDFQIADTAPEAVEEEATESDDEFVLTDDFLVPEPEPEPELVPKEDVDETLAALATVASALQALAEAQDRSEAEVVGAGDELILTDDFLAPEPETPAPQAEPPPPQEPAETTETTEPEQVQDTAPASPLDTAQWIALVDAVIAAHAAPGTPPTIKGDATLPDDLDALARLLADPPPSNDFAALDALYTCWPKHTADSSSRALLAVAQALSRQFGLPGKLPMSMAKAWRMLSPSEFEAELAQRLADVGTFIADWQKTQRTFLILEFGEIELIEYLFEALHPGYHADILAGVMNFKVLSNRRMGLLRRIPMRIKKQIAPLLPANKERALTELVHVRALLERVATETGFAPIVETANKAQEEVEKMMKAVANIGAPPPAPGAGGGALGRIG